MKVRMQGRIVGDLVGSTLVKRGRQVQMMNIMGGFGIPQAQVLDMRIEKFRLHYGGKVYKARVGDFINSGIPYHRPPYEPQFILPLKYFECLDDKQTNLLKEN